MNFRKNRFDSHRVRFDHARRRELLTLVERMVLRLKFNAHRSAKLDRCVAEYEASRKGAA